MVTAVFLGIPIVQNTVKFVRQCVMMHLSIHMDILAILGYLDHILKAISESAQ